MIAIGSYFVFSMFVMGTICDDTPEFSEDEKKQFFKDIKNEHNKYRIMHGVPKLKLNEELSELTTEPVLIYGLLNEKIPLGVNYNQKQFLLSSKLNATLAEEIVADWYNTGANYNYDAEPSSEIADPFTQIVWKETKIIGVAVLWVNNVLYVAVSYDDVGNKKGDNHYINNVQRPQIA